MKPLLPLVVLAVLLPSANANPIITSSTTCTETGQVIPCGTDLIIAAAIDRLTGLGTAAGIQVSVDAITQTLLVRPGQNTPDASAEAAAAIDFFATTDGPARVGFATYTIGMAGIGFGQQHTASVAAIPGITDLLNCPGSPLCDGRHGIGRTLVPFELGVPFEIDMTAYSFTQQGSELGSLGDPGRGAEGLVNVTLQLFEANGTPVTIFETAVPEPSAWGLIALGLIIGASFRKWARYN